MAVSEASRRLIQELATFLDSEEGVMGSGPMAETLYSLYKKYMELRKKKPQG
jgi:hypothetical protein